MVNLKKKRERIVSSRNLKREGESGEKEHTAGELSDELQHPDWPSGSERHYDSWRTTRTEQDLYSHMSTNTRRIIIRKSSTIQPGKERKKSCSIPTPPPKEAWRQARQSTALRSHCVPLLIQRSCYPRKQQTSTWEHSRTSQPAPPPQTEAEVTTEEVQREDGLLKRFPNRGPGTSRRPFGVCVCVC